MLLPIEARPDQTLIILEYKILIAGFIHDLDGAEIDSKDYA
ncbi:hypothetical protein OKA06_11565 [Novosphingobium sp. MW5]|nr:hypothetical protein [Novosphingobium sp. MW5]